jgi:hypothetical protein
VYFSVLEGLQNVAKYAHATHAIVILYDEGGRLSFQVRDDGVGFDLGATGLGSGLQGMADRLAAIDGTLEVRSEPGSGTTVAGIVLSHRRQRVCLWILRRWFPGGESPMDERLPKDGLPLALDHDVVGVVLPLRPSPPVSTGDLSF